MRTNVLTSADRQAVLRRAKQGESLSVLAREFGVTVQAISYHTRGALGPRLVRKVTPDMVREMKRQWDQGATAREIGPRLGISETTVSKYIRSITGRSGRLKHIQQFFPPKDQEDLSYLAATLDAEGCICRRQEHSLHWHISITGSSPMLMDWLRQWGGQVYEAPRQARTGARKGLRKQVYIWKLTSMWDIACMLDALLPFMIEKQGRAAATVEEILHLHGPPPWAPEVKPIRD